MATFIRFYCENEYEDSLTVRKIENQLSINFWENDKLKKEIVLSKDDCKILIDELNRLYFKLNNNG